ncbi:hypothetical protein WICMUC_005901 [Wickerhamomyces mucosus]|uniref:B30.2/SPRY domain-containing protein n=1 Tax=Wickerhamomyces mucosus TaxID=1378264 RepID=A0A9P8P2P6_9ASCO|nr:hypothetical protein WICMUC_005901 [Wickerhamomyces mucosus]
MGDYNFEYNLPLLISISIGLGSNFNIPGEFDDEEHLLDEEFINLPKLNDNERINYIKAKNFNDQFKPQIKPLGSSLTDLEIQFIKDRGIQSYQFNQPSNDKILIQDKLDVEFKKNSQNLEPMSIILNYPLPIKNNSTNDTVYFEVKFFTKPIDTLVSIGLTSIPYPLFRLPGYNKYSIAYESNGSIRINQPFETPQIWNKVIEGDIIGVGFKFKTGTIFFTHNGKKLTDVIHNVKFDLYPIIGSIGNCKVSFNLGQLGFVFIEANVKKWGFGSIYGQIGIPPAYGKEIINDKVLDRGEELPPNYPINEENFFNPFIIPLQIEQNQIEQNPQIISNPPSYKDEPKLNLIKNQDEINKVENNEILYERNSSIYDLENNNQFDDEQIGSSSNLVDNNNDNNQTLNILNQIKEPISQIDQIKKKPVTNKRKNKVNKKKNKRKK